MKTLFSVIMPIFNTEGYLREAFETLENQTLSFDGNIQLILVNDGSADNSGQICREFCEKHPNNTIYLEQENMGVSAARNKGLEYAEGKYTVFMDSDDTWEKNAFDAALMFFEENHDEENVAAASLKYPWTPNKHDISDRKFENGNRVINIAEEPTAVLQNAAGVFIKTEIAKAHKFDTELTLGEDSKYITEIIVRAGKYAVISDAVYNHRVRRDGTSLRQIYKNDMEKAADILKKHWLPIMKGSIENNGEVSDFLQYSALQNIISSITNITYIPEMHEEAQGYMECFREALSMIYDRVILKSTNAGFSLRMYLLSIKGGRRLDSLVKVDEEGKMFYIKRYLGALSKPSSFYITDIDHKNNKLYITGFIEIAAYVRKFAVYANCGNRKYTARFLDEYTNERRSFTGDVYYGTRKFSLEIPIKQDRAVISLNVGYDKYNYELKGSMYNDLQDHPYDLYKMQSSFLVRGRKKVTLDEEENLVVENAKISHRLENFSREWQEGRVLFVTKGSINKDLDKIVKEKQVEFDEIISDNGYIASCLQNGKIIGHKRGTTYVNLYKEKKHVLEVRIIVLPVPRKAHPLFVTRKNGVGKLLGFIPDGLVKKEAGSPNWNPDKDIYLCRKAARAYERMCEAASEDNIYFIVTHGYRSVALQKEMVDALIKKRGRARALRRGAPPGFSEHHTGLAMDIGGLPEVTADADAYKWIEDNCWKYGFMVKNLKGKEHITGTQYEPWHIRYIGNTKITKLLHDNYWTLDEYLDSI